MDPQSNPALRPGHSHHSINEMGHMEPARYAHSPIRFPNALLPRVSLANPKFYKVKQDIIFPACAF